MKKTLLSIAFALMGVTSIFAAKAKPGLTNIIQSDGSQLTIRLNGDENHHWYSTSDGILLVQVGSSYYIAQVEEDGSLKATPQLAHNENARGERELNVIAQQDKEKFFNVISEDTQVLAKPIGSTNPAYFPHIGSPKALVILVQFQDVKFKTTDPIATFTHYLKGEAGEAAPEANNAYSSQWNNYGSVLQYFHDMSGGQFTPQFDIVGPVTVSKNSAYYGSNGNGREGGDTYFTEMIAEACKQVSGQVNFADYDQNNDGYVDLVYIIYAGYSESINGNSADCLWPKSGTAGIYDPDNSNQLLTLNGKKIRRYGINNEINGKQDDTDGEGRPLLNGIGLFCHEFTHTMGIPDLYPTVGSSRVDNQNPEYWDLMDGGEYTYNGYCPTPYTPWEMDVMGWTTPTDLGKEAIQVSLNSYANDRTAYKINGENAEYLLLQNIQKEGWWKYQFGHGLLVWRIDYPYETVSLDNKLNNTIGKPNVMIVPADGYVISDYNHGEGYQWTDAEYNASLKADPFPGTQNVTELLSVKLNNSTLEKPIYNIKEENGIITFDYLKDFTTGIDSPITNTDTDKDARIYTLDGRYVGTDASQLTKGVYIIGKKKVVIK